MAPSTATDLVIWRLEGVDPEELVKNDDDGGHRQIQVASRLTVEELLEEDMFMESLICNMDVDCEKLLVCKIDLDCVKTLHFDTEENYYSGRCNYTQANDTSRTYEMGKSPFPSLDKFVESIASIGSISGKIRSWYWFSEYGLIVYSMSRNRYCERIGREHKSNHVIYVVDLKRGFYYQKCHDPDCQGYRSPLRPIRINLIPDAFLYDLVQVVHRNEMTNSNLDSQHVNNGCERVLLYNDGNETEGCDQDSWWTEAIRVADDVECKHKSLELGNMNINEEDDDWWMAVERTASEAEVIYSS